MIPSGKVIAAGDDHELPAPEDEPREPGCKKRRATRSLDHVERRAEERAPAEREDDGVRVERSESPVAEVRDVEVQLGPGELAAMTTPTSIPTMPQTIVMIVN